MCAGSYAMNSATASQVWPRSACAAAALSRMSARIDRAPWGTGLLPRLRTKTSHPRRSASFAASSEMLPVPPMNKTFMRSKLLPRRQAVNPRDGGLSATADAGAPRWRRPTARATVRA